MGPPPSTAASVNGHQRDPERVAGLVVGAPTVVVVGGAMAMAAAPNNGDAAACEHLERALAAFRADGGGEPRPSGDRRAVSLTTPEIVPAAAVAAQQPLQLQRQARAPAQYLSPRAKASHASAQAPPDDEAAFSRLVPARSSDSTAVSSVWAPASSDAAGGGGAVAPAATSIARSRPRRAATLAAAAASSGSTSSGGSSGSAGSPPTSNGAAPAFTLRPPSRGAPASARPSTPAAELVVQRAREKRRRVAAPERSVRVGLVNLGNTCYINAVIQSMFHVGAMSNGASSSSSASNGAEGAVPPSHCGVATLDSLVDAFREVFAAAGLPPLARRQQQQQQQQLQPDPAHVHAHAQPRAGAALPARPPSGADEDLHVAQDPSFFVALVKRRMPVFDSLHQQDAHEFLRLFSDHLQRERAWESDPFAGTILSQVACPLCSQPESKLDPCLDLSLELPESDANGHVVRFEAVRAGGPLTNARPLRLDDCLKRFVHVERVSRAAESRCAACGKSLAEALAASPGKLPSPRAGAGAAAAGWTKRLSLWSLPRLLVVHLKRFKLTLDGTYDKVNAFVQFPVRNFSLRAYRAPPDAVAPGSPASAYDATDTLYELVAAVVHHGRTLGGGHYTAYCRDGDRWLHYNDEHVVAVNEEVVCRCEAYLLFYAVQGAAGSSAVSAGPRPAQCSLPD